MSILLEKIGAKIRAVRSNKGLTQENVADMLKMSHSGYAKIERGEVDVSVQRLEQIAQVFQVAAHEIMQLSENQNFVFNQSGLNNLGVSHNQNQIINMQDYKKDFENIQKEFANLTEIVRKLAKEIEVLKKQK